MITVDEVKDGPLRKTAGDRMPVIERHIVPTDMRQPQSRILRLDQAYGAGNEPETRMAPVFEPFGCEELHPETDAEQRFLLRQDLLAQRGNEAPLGESLHPFAEAPHAGQDDVRGGRESLRIGADLDAVEQARNGVTNRGQVSDAVIDDDNVGRHVAGHNTAKRTGNQRFPVPKTQVFYADPRGECDILPPMSLENLSILVTGGTGSFGKKFVEMVLRGSRPHKLIVFSRDELKQHEMRVHGLTDPCMRYFIGDVRDRERLRRAMNGVDVVIHTAALKHVSACEYNPIEAVQTNIIGAQNIINAAIDAGVKKVLALSTDKAVNPVNLYGASKLCAEKLFIQGNAYSGAGGTLFSCVRYGNVMGSRGSVIPLFREQRKTGTISVTDERMTRFWLTLEQGVNFVLHCLDQMHGGEIFVPKIPSAKLVDLVATMAPDCKKTVTGIRAGEKLHECLISEDEARHTVELSDMYVIEPEDGSWGFTHWEGKRPPENFRYTSDTNKAWLSPAQLRSLVDTA